MLATWMAVWIVGMTIQGEGGKGYQGGGEVLRCKSQLKQLHLCKEPKFPIQDPIPAEG